MLKRALNHVLQRMATRYNYDVSYLQHLLQRDTTAFLKFNSVMLLSRHHKGIEAAPLFAASLRAAISEDCGPCIQLVSNMAQEAGVSPTILDGILRADTSALPEDVALVLRFTEQVLAHQPEANDSRRAIRQRWGEDALISIGFAISSARVYPTFKYAMGFGQACSRVEIAEQSVLPVRQLA